MQTPKARSGSSEGPPKVSSRALWQINTTALESKSASSSNQTCRTPKDKSPKVIDRRSPRSPVSERKRPSRISELESQVSRLQEELKKVKDQLILSESWKHQAQQDAEDSKQQLLSMSSKLEESQKQLQKLSASEEACAVELQKVSVERDQAWQTELEDVQNQHSVDSAALASALNELQQLKAQLEMVAESEALQTKNAESAHGELQSLKGNLIETRSLVENMKNQLKESKESETQAQALASETLIQLETAKRSIEALRADGMKAIDAYNSIMSELEQSRARVNSLEGLVSKLQANADNTNINFCHDCAGNHDLGQKISENQETTESNQLQEELYSLRAEVGRLRPALEITETKLHEQQIQSTVLKKSAFEQVEQLKCQTGLKEAELEAELEQAKSDIEELKANLMDKETELQGISEENESIRMQLDKNQLCQRETQLNNDLQKLTQSIEDLKANLMDKETELQNISEENEMLKLKISKREPDTPNVNNDVAAELEAARSAEKEALTKVGLVMEEADKTSRRAARLAEQLEAAQAANCEAEAELRRLKVQSDQWRKAAEAAASMLSTGNNGKFVERSGSIDSNYNPITGKIPSCYSDDMDDDLLKKKNGNVLKKIGVLWKKPQK